MEISLRLYNKSDNEDYKQLLPFMKSFLEDYGGKKEVHEIRANSAIFAFLSPKKEANEAYFIEKENHGTIGYCIVTRDYRTNSFNIHHFFISPPFRRDKEHHWGTAAFNLLKLLYNPDYITVDVINGNETAREFWKSFGFVESIESFSKIPGFPLVYKLVLYINVNPKRQQRN
jgi:hypothetical protein